MKIKASYQACLVSFVPHKPTFIILCQTFSFFINFTFSFAFLCPPLFNLPQNCHLSELAGGGGVRNFEYWLGEKYVFVTVWCSYVYIIQHVYMLLYLFRDWEALFLFSFITNLQVVLLFFLFCNSILNIIRYSISLFLFFFFLILVLLNNMVHISCVPQIFFSLECSWKWC